MGPCESGVVVEVVSSEQRKINGGLGNLRFVYEVWFSLGKKVRVGVRL